jgi:hypothetical protein
MRTLEPSPYCPPRARWFGPLVRMVERIRCIAWLDRIHLPEGVSFCTFLSALFVPGVAFRLRRERLLGNAILGAYVLLAFVFVLGLGSLVGNVAFGVMLSLHATSLLCLLGPWLNHARLFFRLLAALAVVVMLSGLIYMPIRNHIQQRWLIPLRVEGRVIIVQTVTSAAAVQAGDWVAYRIDGDGARGLVIREGFALQRVMGMPGDEIHFTRDAVKINGVPRPRLSRMPVTGGFIVPEKHWFIWPEHAMTVRGNDAPGIADAAFLRLADVNQSQFVGKPFRRWLWRQQTMP